MDADPDVLLDVSIFLVGELAGLLQDAVVHADLADVVQQAHQVEVALVVRRHLQLLADPHGDPGHPLGMARGVRVLGVDRGGQGADHAEEEVLQVRVAPRVRPLGADQRGDREQRVQVLVGRSAGLGGFDGEEPAAVPARWPRRSSSAASSDASTTRIISPVGGPRQGAVRLGREARHPSRHDHGLARRIGHPGHGLDPQRLARGRRGPPLEPLGRVRHPQAADQPVGDRSPCPGSTLVSAHRSPPPSSNARAMTGMRSERLWRQPSARDSPADSRNV